MLATWGAGKGSGPAPAVYAPQGVQIHPDVGAKYPAGVLPDTLRVVVFALYYAGPGSFANSLYPNARGTNNKVLFGSMAGTPFSAETAPGSNLLLDHSAPNNALWRFNAAVDVNRNANMAFGPDAATPGMPSNLWIADLVAFDAAHPSGTKVGGALRNGSQELTTTVTQTGSWDELTPIMMSSKDWFINANIPATITPGEFWCAQYAMWYPTADQLATLLNPDGTFVSSAAQKFFSATTGPQDLLADGSGPGIGTPVVYHELRAGETFDKFFENKGNLGADPTLVASANAAIGRVFRAPLDPVATTDRPFRAGFNLVDTTALNDATSGGGAYAGIKNYGQRIKGVAASKTLIVIWVNMGYDAGGLRDPTLTDQHSVAYTRNKYVSGPTGETMVFTKVADANDETAQFADWANAPTLAWTPQGGFGDGHPSITIAFYEGPTTPLVQDAQGQALPAATPTTGYVCDAVTATTDKGLMIAGIGTLSIDFEHGLSPPASMDLGVACGANTRLPQGGPMFLAEEKINTTGSTGTRTFACLGTGNNPFREISILLQNSEAYPASVVAAGLQSVWDLYTTSGSRVSSYTAFGSFSKPAGVTQTSGATGAGCTIASTNSIAGIDFTGFGIFALNTGTTATITDSIVTSATSDFRLWNGQNTNGGAAGAPTLSFQHCTVDLNPGESTEHAMIQNFANAGPMTINGCRIYNSPRTGAAFLKGTVSITNTLWGAFGTVSNPGDHSECVQLTDGDFAISGCLFDPTYQLPCLNGITGDIQCQAIDGVATTLEIDHCIFANSAGLLDAPLSFKADFADVTVTISDCVIQKGMQVGPGATGYVITAFNAGQTLTIIDGGGNIDFDDGHALNLAEVVGP